MGESERARRAFDEGLATARALGSPSSYASALITYGVHLLDTNPNRAVEILEEAASTFESIGHRLGSTTSRFALGMLQMRTSRFSAALHTFALAIDDAVAIGDRGTIANVLDGAAGALARLGDVETAARVTGAVEGLRAELGFRNWWDFLSPPRDDLTPARDALGAARFDELRAEGRKLRIEDILQRVTERAEVLGEP